MEVTKINISDPGGLHLRKAASVVRLAQKFSSRIYLCQGCKLADTCSILEVLALTAKKNTEVAVVAEGSDEKEAIRQMSQLFSNGAGI